MTNDDAVQTLVALGTNLPFGELHGAALVEAALEALGQEGLRLAARSGMHTTPAWPDPFDPPFTNAVALFYATGMGAQDVLALLGRVEARFGRVRGRANAPRTLDLDLLDFGGCMLDTPSLVLPHPRMRTRLFVLEPLAEAAPGWRDPVTGDSVEAMLSRLRGPETPNSAS